MRQLGATTFTACSPAVTKAGDLFRELAFPAPPGAPRAASRQASRLHFVMRYYRGRLLGLLQLAPALFIGITALAGFALPFEEWVGATGGTARLAARCEHVVMVLL